ncbi:TPA: G-2 and S-phase expressed 1 [Bos taurus]|uniref:G2 and S-phase expressed 1 n=1 Tax=Bos taurus TaxID=9913 RepID=F6Q0H8_BOVIN|nr:TPA: G-2 and S-phase expressed 1 [Bos taurus]
MEAPKKEDILLLADEKFDFDLSLSSSSANEDDEVFFGPIGHKERCIAASLELNNQIPEEPPLPASERHFIWSPLAGEKFVEVYKEAHLLAFQIQSNGRTTAAQAAQPEDPGGQGGEGFIQEPKLKINLFDRENEVKKSPKSLKRETYCLSDDLWRAPLLRGTQPASSAAPLAAPAQTGCPETSGPPPTLCPSLPAEPSAAQWDKTGGTRRRDSCLNSKTKAVATPTNQFKIPRFSTGEPPDGATPKSCRAQRPQSCTSVGRVAHSTPMRWSSAAQSLVSSMRTPVSTRRLSALPTPAGRRLSSLPLATPTTVPRLLASPLPTSAKRLSSEPPKKSTVRTAPAMEGDGQPASRRLDLSPNGSCSPPSAVPQALDFSPEKSDFTFSQSVTVEVTLDEAQPPEATAPSEALLVDLKLDQLSLTMEAAATALDDRPLIDFCRSPEAVVALRSGSGPLVDLLTNTPEANRKAVAKPPDEVGQLIDLASPLILLSPEADKENMESPLLKF